MKNVCLNEWINTQYQKTHNFLPCIFRLNSCIITFMQIGSSLRKKHLFHFMWSLLSSNLFSSSYIVIGLLLDVKTVQKKITLHFLSYVLHCCWWKDSCRKKKRNINDSEFNYILIAADTDFLKFFFPPVLCPIKYIYIFLTFLPWRDRWINFQVC